MYFRPSFVSKEHLLPCWFVIIQDGGGVSYVKSDLGYRMPGDTISLGEGNDSRPYATGDVHQTFDSRLAMNGRYRFDPDQADMLRVTITPIMPSSYSLSSESSEARIQVSFDGITWPGSYTLQGLTCHANVLSGYGPAIGREGEALFALALGSPYVLG
jgi:hypothetical protein